VNGDRVEIVIDAGRPARTRFRRPVLADASMSPHGQGRRGDGATQGATSVRTARFMATRSLALIEHPARAAHLPDDGATVRPPD
jgi:hypothetical protein